jgi:transposase
MPPSYVKAYVKRQKNNTADAEAICEAVTRPTMRFVEVKSPEQQSIMVVRGTRVMLMRQRIQLSNAIRRSTRHHRQSSAIWPEPFDPHQPLTLAWA